MISTAAHAKSDLDELVSAYANQVKACRQDWDVACDSYKRACGNWTQEQLGKRYHVKWGPNETHPEWAARLYAKVRNPQEYDVLNNKCRLLRKLQS
jgi:hypothetical protein